MNLLTFKFYDKSAGLSIIPSKTTLIEMDGRYGGSGSEYFQIFDKASAPVANDVPIKSFPLTAAGPLPSIFQVLGALNFDLGLAVGISTVNEKYTASASEYDVFGETETRGLPAAAGTTVVAEGAGADTYTVYDDGAGNVKRLVSFSVANAEGATRYVMLFADPNLSTLDGSVPIAEWTILTGTTIVRNFGVPGSLITSVDSSRVIHNGAYLSLSTTAATLTLASGSGGTFNGTYL